MHASHARDITVQFCIKLPLSNISECHHIIISIYITLFLKTILFIYLFIQQSKEITTKFTHLISLNTRITVKYK